jgi:hypothetical protein
MIKLPPKFEVGDLLLTQDEYYWSDSHVNQLVCIREIDWGRETISVTHPHLEFNEQRIPYHQFKHFKLISKRTPLSDLVYL